MKNIWLESSKPLWFSESIEYSEFLISISKGSRKVTVRGAELRNLRDHDNLCAEDELSRDLIARLQFDGTVRRCFLKEHEKFQVHVAIQMARRKANRRDIAEFKRISIPLVRRIYPQLIADKIVSVQPLLGPSSLVHYLRFRYSEVNGKRVSKVISEWKE